MSSGWTIAELLKEVETLKSVIEIQKAVRRQQEAKAASALAEAQAEVERLRLENTHLDQSLSPANQAALDAMLASPPACEGERVDVLKVTYPKGLYRVMGYAFQDGDTVTIEAAQLPGCITQGNTLAEAIEHFKEAAQACIETYLAHGEPIPWQDVERPEISRRVTVFVQAEPAAPKPAVQDEQLTPANEKFLDEMLASKPAAGGESQDITDQNSLLGALAAANQRADEVERRLAAQSAEIDRLTVLADINRSEFEQVKELQANIAKARQHISAQSAELDALRSKIKGLGQGFEVIRDCEKNECAGCQHVATTYAAIAAEEDKP